MGNHFHLVLETPKANLVAGMKWFWGTYSSRFNRRHRLFGHLFSGRYKALLVDGSGSGYHNGKVYVYHGSSSGLPATAKWTATLDPTFDQEFGWSVAGAGDVNGDSYGDVIVGAPRYSNGQSNEGVALIWHGSSTGLTPNPGTRSNPARLLEKNQANAS